MLFAKYLTADENKGIENITYNHLNLPTEIQFSNGSKIAYLYNAAGQKVQKDVNNTSYSIITDYLDGFQYVNQALNFFPHAEGYVNVEGTNEDGYKFFYVYNYTDHLGNIRVSYGFDPDTQTLKTLEENHYYPFGLKHTNYNTYKRKFTQDEPPLDTPPSTLGTDFKIKQIPGGETLAYKYRYNGQEYQDELGLNMYDYGARNYDPALGRWMNIDPLAEKDRRWTPYKYCYNNPLRFIDPDGMGEFEPTKTGDLIIEEGDTEEKLLKEYGVKVNWAKADKGFNFSPGQKINLDNNVTRAIDRSTGGTVEEINSGQA